MRATDRARGTPKPHAARRHTRDDGSGHARPVSPGALLHARTRRQIQKAGGDTLCLGPSASVARPKTPATLMATRSVYAPVLQELRGAMRGPETNLSSHLQHFAFAEGAHAPSLNLHFPMQHHAPRVGCARARPSAALHTSGGWLLRVFRRNPSP